MNRYLSLQQATREFRVTAARLAQLTGDGKEFPLNQWAGSSYYGEEALKARFRWRKSRAERAREISYVLLNFRSPTRH